LDSLICRGAVLLFGSPPSTSRLSYSIVLPVGIAKILKMHSYITKKTFVLKVGFICLLPAYLK
jgi:hypothetical protein